MKKLSSIITVLVTVLIFSATACSNGADSGNGIVGEWKVTEAVGTAASMNQGVVYNFTKDGNANVAQTEYTYTTSGDTLTMNYNGGNDIVLIWSYKIDGEQLVLQNLTDDSQILTFEKQ